MSAPDPEREPLALASPAKAMGSAPRRDDEIVFSAPWEARAFALAVLAHRSGLFGWSEWTNRLGEAIGAGDKDGVGGARVQSEYYHCWLTALERILVASDSLSEEELLRRRREWREAAQRTPHGEPVEL